jgi:hypothetical protein
LKGAAFEVRPGENEPCSTGSTLAQVLAVTGFSTPTVWDMVVDFYLKAKDKQ